MSSREERAALVAIETSALELVVGSQTSWQGAGPNRIYTSNWFSSHSAAYTDQGFCIGTMDGAANKKYPDTRGFLQRALGAKDRNADARAEWLSQAIKPCVAAPTS